MQVSEEALLSLHDMNTRDQLHGVDRMKNDLSKRWDIAILVSSDKVVWCNRLQTLMGEYLWRCADVWLSVIR